jgi:hypothetical protein
MRNPHEFSGIGDGPTNIPHSLESRVPRRKCEGPPSATRVHEVAHEVMDTSCLAGTATA